MIVTQLLLCENFCLGCNQKVKFTLLHIKQYKNLRWILLTINLPVLTHLLCQQRISHFCWALAKQMNYNDTNVFGYRGLYESLVNVDAVCIRVNISTSSFYILFSCWLSLNVNYTMSDNSGETTLWHNLNPWHHIAMTYIIF